MIITHTVNAKGERRIYLGGKSSLECWIEPDVCQRGWSLRLEPAVTGNSVSEAERRQWAFKILLRLADTLDVTPEHLASVPFDRIAALHVENPFNSRRCALPRNKSIENGFVALAPGKAQPLRGQAGEAISILQRKVF